MWRRGVKVWPYQLAIALAWLLVPLTAYLMLRADYEQYQRDSAAQRADCAKRAELLKTYSTSLADWSRRVDSITDQDDYQAWMRHMQHLQEWYDKESSTLRQSVPVYYPKLDTMLLEAATDVLHQQQQLEEAARRRTDYVNSAQGMDELLEQIRLDEARAEQFLRQGYDQIYYYFMLDLQRVSDEYDRRALARQRMYRDSAEAQSAAAADRGAALRRMERFNDLAGQDEQQTYAGLLKLRLASFNLRDELRRLLLQGQASAGP